MNRIFKDNFIIFIEYYSISFRTSITRLVSLFNINFVKKIIVARNKTVENNNVSHSLIENDIRFIMKVKNSSVNFLMSIKA